VTTFDTLINMLFDGRYRIVRKLGSGGMADVYLAEDEELGRRIAIKILNDRHANDESFVERFRREAKNAAGLSHPNIVSIYDRGEAEGTYYIAMEYLDGRSLKELVVARGPLPIPDAIDATRQVLAALRFAHRKGVVHRDIKPHNVMADADGRLKVTDFGIARAGVSQMTEAGSIIGTAQYLSPEQARGAAVDQRSDLYSVGVVLYEMLTGKTPFTGESPVEIAMKHLSDPPRPPSVERPDIPPDLDMIVLRALAKNPDDRFQTAEEMDAELERVSRGAGVSTETADAATAVLSSRPAGRRPPLGLATGTRSRRRAAVPSGHGCWHCCSSSWPESPAGTRSGRSRTPWAEDRRPRCRTSSASGRISRSRTSWRRDSRWTCTERRTRRSRSARCSTRAPTEASASTRAVWSTSVSPPARRGSKCPTLLANRETTRSRPSPRPS
jgi:serine/threonine protein kinase